MGVVCIGVVCIGVVCIGVVCIDVVCIGVVRMGVVCIGVVRMGVHPWYCATNRACTPPAPCLHPPARDKPYTSGFVLTKNLSHVLRKR